ncbi:MAG: methyltransferase domain-containing protein, partial [Bacillota bacterium]
DLPSEIFVGCDLAPHGVIYRGGGNPADREEYRRGLYSIQSEASQLLTVAATPSPGDSILDACAGRGGKSTYLAELCDDRGRILAVDKYRNKLEFLNSEAKRLGLSSIEVLAGDMSVLEPPHELKDLVFVDVPCSGLGTIGREADARWHKTPQMLTEMPKIQKNLLGAASRWVAPGGLLMYATCSVAPEENEKVSEIFARDNSNFVPADMDSGLPGVSGHRMNLLPQEHGTDGAYAALFRRR